MDILLKFIFSPICSIIVNIVNGEKLDRKLGFVA